MAGKTKISLEKIEAVRKKLRKLPPKDTGKNMAETMEMLATDVRNTLKKGYSLKEVRDFLAEDGLMFSASLLKKYLEPDQEVPPLKTEVRDDKTETQSTEALIVKPDTPEDEL
jgi:hypothetical protein